MNDNKENIPINAEKRVPTLVMRQLSTTRAFCHFNMHNTRTQTHFDTKCMLTEPFRVLMHKMSRPDMRVIGGSAGMRQAVVFSWHQDHA